MASKQTICSKKRTTTLVKKTSELATLCGTDALIIILENNPTDPGSVQSHPIRSHTWPESPDEVNSILKRYQDYCSSNHREPKRRKIEEAGDVSADDASGLLGLLDSKLLMVESRVRELEEDRIRCCGNSPEEPPFVPVAMDVCSDQNMFLCGAGSWDQMCSPMCCSSSSKEPPFVPVVMDVSSDHNMFVCGAGSWDQMCSHGC